MPNVPRRTTVTVEPHHHDRWRVAVTYPSGGTHTLLTTPDHDEAIRAARGYAIKHGWSFEDGGSDE